jgi:hypothetical protein
MCAQVYACVRVRERVNVCVRGGERGTDEAERDRRLSPVDSSPESDPIADVGVMLSAT